MTRKRVVGALVLLASVGAGWQLGGAERGRHGTLEAAEVARLRSHFAQVERELLERDVSALAPAQRTARAEQIRLLRRYAADGRFPQNDRFPGRRVPFFRDAQGTLCAMAFLIAWSGRGDIVDHVALTRNNAYLPELADEPGLMEWLEQHGLTVAEAARIQPSYDGGGIIEDGESRVGSGYIMATTATSGLAAATLFWNARSLDRTREHRWHGGLGLVVGGVGVALGASRIGDPGDGNTVLGSWNIALGATAAILGARVLLGRSRTSSASRRSEPSLRLVPIAVPGSMPHLGLAGRLQL